MTGRRWAALRVLFVLAVVGGAWWTWRASGQELAAALEQVSGVRVLLGTALAACGVVCTGLVWRVALGSFDVEVPVRGAMPSFFVAQLGKYIPGSVWSFAAQGAWGVSRGMSGRVPVAAAVLFLGIHVASGLVLVGLTGWWTSLPGWVVILSLVVGSCGLAPAVYRLVGSRLAGRPCRWGLRTTALGALAMLPVWSSYTAALVTVTPQPTLTLALTLGCSFAVAFAAGVAVPIAPAGIGARDGLLLVLITPALGLSAAGAVVVLARLFHTVADFAVAAASWAVLRLTVEEQPSDTLDAPH